MADTPLSQALIRCLTDKLYEKRKAAALDIEKLVRDLHASNQLSQLSKVLEQLRELCMSQNNHTRQGGLIGLAAAAIALGKNTPQYTSQLIEPVIDCFNDPDLRVRYYACESLYNIIKIAKQASLVHFDKLFDVLWKLSADTEQNVRSAAELLDRLLMDIVCSKHDFDVANLMCLIRERVYVQTSSNRKFLLQWLNSLLTTPHFTCLPFLSEVIDGLLRMLGDPQPVVRESTETVVGQFLDALIKDPDTLNKEDLSTVVNVLAVHSHEDEPPLVRKISLIWLHEFVKIYRSLFFPHLSVCLTAVLPALDKADLRAKAVNDSLMQVVGTEGEIVMDNVIDTLLNHLKHPTRPTRLATLHWVKHLHAHLPEQLFEHMDRLFPVLLDLLSDSSDEVLLLDLHLISDICQGEHKTVDRESLGLSESTTKQLLLVSPFLIKFSISLIAMFEKDPQLLTERGVLIIRQLCLLLEPSHIYHCLCVLLLEHERISFVQGVVAVLHSVLLTSTELFLLRDRIRRLEDEECKSLFVCLYRCWCVRPIALLGLCLLSQSYEHAAQLSLLLSQVDVTVDVLVEIDKLVNLLESPILAFVRMDLLNACHQKSLCTVLSALLMLLPQSEAFNTLHKRLQAVPALTIFGDRSAPPPTPKVDFVPLMECFRSSIHRLQKEVRDRHRDVLRASVTGMMTS